MRYFSFVLLLFISVNNLFAQVLIYTEPFFPTLDDDVTVYYDASQGDAGLAAFPGDVYAHTGVITNNSTSPTDWKHVTTSWGTTDPIALMTDEGNNIYSKSFNIRDYYNVPSNETVSQMAFVFRSGDGSITGRQTDGSDIFSPVYPDNSTLAVRFLTPTSDFITSNGTSINIFAVSSIDADLFLYDNGSLVEQTTGTSINTTITAAPGGHFFEFVAEAGGVSETANFTYIVPGTVNVAPIPAGMESGVNYTANDAVTLVLDAPGKDFVYVRGDFNDWGLDNNYLMNKTTDGLRFWIELDNLTPDTQYAFQYMVDGVINIADPLAELILDPNSDGGIPSTVYPNIPAYPYGKTSGIVSVMHPGKPAYNWQNDNFNKPPQSELIIYELLMRDFLDDHSYQSLIDTLDYLERLGINAIELMPVNEFENNDSWGYNPSFHNALDKYYGTAEDFKAFIDAAHARDIAVIVDVVFNHAFSQSPLCQLYWDAENFRPAPDNPWLNEVARHPFNVGYDFNHESQFTKRYMDRCLTYWLDTYHIDGFRFDLSKGFSQVDYGDDVGAWSAYDASRVALIKRVADVIWDNAPDTYVILEHLGTNAEEEEYSDYGMMLWGNFNYNYNEASMGYGGNSLAGATYKDKGWADPHLVAYMESHDEERLMFKNLAYGNSFGNYDVKTLDHGLRRQELVSTFYYTVPGPKMLWQFGELGYDYSINRCVNGTINENCRLDRKPIRWDYYDDSRRRQVYEVTRALMALRENYPAFHTTDFNQNELAGGYFKDFHLNHADFDVTVLGNFNVFEGAIDPSFQSTGTWYEYFTGESIEVTDVNATINLLPGEYRIYTSNPIMEPPGGYFESYTVGTETLVNNLDFSISPNPAKEQLNISFSETLALKQILIKDVNGKTIMSIPTSNISNYTTINIQDLSQGIYFIEMLSENKKGIEKFVKI